MQLRSCTTSGEWSTTVCGAPVYASSSSGQRLTSHAALSSGRDTVRAGDVAEAPAKPSSKVHVRGDRFGKEFPGTAMCASSGQIHSTTGLGAAKVRVVIRQANWRIHAQEPSIRVDDLHVVGIGGCDTLSRATDIETGTGRVHGHNGSQSATGGTLTSQTGSVAAQTVAHNDHRGEGGTRGLVQEVDHLGYAWSHLKDAVAGSGVVTSLRTRSPVNDDHVEGSTVQVCGADASVDRRSSVIIPAVDDEAADEEPC